MSEIINIKESKQIIYTLAQTATDKIYKNKFLIEEIDSLKNHIKLIKEILINCSSLNTNNNSKKKLISENINNIYNSLKASNQKLFGENIKYQKKLDNHLNNIFNEKDVLKQKLSTQKIDNFILVSKLKEKDNEITKLTNLIEAFIVAKIFPIEKIDKRVGYNKGYYYLDEIKEHLSNNLMKELLYFNLYNRHCLKLKKKKEKLKNKKNYYNEIIIYLNKIPLQTKSFNEDINTVPKFEIINKKDKMVNSQKNKKIPNITKKIDILTVSQLFDVNNDEGKSEAIIDDELHSDDDVTFQPKVKQHNKISKGARLEQIKEKIPKVDLSLIEFNKKKVMNEADLYSLEKRKMISQDIDQQIKEIVVRKKEILHKCKINIKKIAAMKKFSEDMQNNYNLLKPLKLKTSVFVCPNENNINIEDKDPLQEIEEINEIESEEDNYNIMKENIIYTQRELKKNKFKKMSVKNIKTNLNNNNSFRKYNNEKISKKEKKREKKKIKVKRSKSK